jgi:pimeloyl-ACP methyl ester carboxylesterase
MAKEEAMVAPAPKLDKPNVVLIHGAFADGSGWEGVYRILKAAGCTVSVVQNSTASVEADVAVTKLAIAAQDGPVVLVAHSYGGVVMTEAGTDPNVAGLVYIASFAPDAGESINTLIADPPPDAPVAPLAPQDGFLFLDKERFPAAFAADVDPEHAAFMADSQVPWGLAAITTEVSEPAWKSRPSWWLIATDDLIIPPDLQRFMSERAGSKVVEIPGNHAIYVSNPTAVAELIQTAIGELTSAS